MSDRPLATVEELTNAHPSHDGGPVVVVGGRPLPLSLRDGMSCRIAEKFINDAHDAAVQSLRGQLAVALGWLRRFHRSAEWNRHNEGDEDRGVHLYITDGTREQLTAAIAAIDADPPGQYVPKSQLDDMAKVLADLQEEKRSPYEARCKAALAALLENFPRRYADGGSSAIGRAMAILEGREPVATVEDVLAEVERAGGLVRRKPYRSPSVVSTKRGEGE